MSKTDDGGPAFPFGEQNDYCEGMMLRDYFAARAMQGYVTRGGGNDDFDLRISKWSYEMADAMLKAREAKP